MVENNFVSEEIINFFEQNCLKTFINNISRDKVYLNLIL